ncbi:MAG: hypothetical protein ACOC49_00050 [Candidatus Bipolaricaulota bacterium]
MPARVRIPIAVLVSLSLLTVAGFVRGSTIEELEKRANADFIPELRKAASIALRKKYVQEEFESSRLEEIAKEARTRELKGSAIAALARNFEDVKRVGSLQEAKEKSEELEEIVKEGETSELKEAASRSLGIYYLAFNLNDIEGYTMRDLEKMAKTDEESGLRRAASTALESIYPNSYSAEELKELIRTSESELIKEAAAGALAIRYYSRISPDISLNHLREIASDEDKNVWLRKAAGIAFGEMARGDLEPDELKSLTRNGETREIRDGAARAWSLVLADSDRTRGELERMAGAATGYAPEAYRSALASALAERLLDKDRNKRGD